MTTESSNLTSTSIEMVEASLPSFVQSSEAQMIQMTVIVLLCVSIILVMGKMANIDLQAQRIRG